MKHLSELLYHGSVSLSLAEQEDLMELLIRFDYKGKAASLTKKVLLQKQQVAMAKVDLLELEIDNCLAQIHQRMGL